MRHINNNKSWSWKLGVLVRHPHPHPHHHHHRRHLWKELLPAVFHCQMENERGVSETKEGEQSKTERKETCFFFPFCCCCCYCCCCCTAILPCQQPNAKRNQAKKRRYIRRVDRSMSVIQPTTHSLTHSLARTHIHTLTQFVIHPTVLRSCWCRRKSLQRYYDKLGKKSSPESTTNYNMKREQSQLAYMQHDAPRERTTEREKERETERASVHGTHNNTAIRSS